MNKQKIINNIMDKVKEWQEDRIIMDLKSDTLRAIIEKEIKK